MADDTAPVLMANTPGWFRRALEQKPASRHTSALDCDIHYLRWGSAPSERPGRPGILFLHAGGANAYWWSFIAPFFATDRAVAAIEFSGMGESGRRATYGSDFHIAEIAAVIADADLGERPIIVGHSFGGYMAMCYGARHGQDLSGIVFADTPVRAEPAEAAGPMQAYSRPVRVYPDRESILQRFRLGPAQPCQNDFILDYIAQMSIARRQDGWSWKFDVAARGDSHHDEPLAEYLRDLVCRKALIYGAESAMVTPESAAFLATLFAPGDPFVSLPEAHHHLFLDQPLAFVATLRAILSGWSS